VDPIVGALFVGLLAVIVATLIEPLVGLAVALFLGLLRAYLHTEVPQIPEQIGQAFLALALGAWVARGLARRALTVRRCALWVPLALFLGVALLSLWDSVAVEAFGLPELLKWVQIALLLLLTGDHLTGRRLPWLLGVLVAIGLFQAAVGIWQFGLRGDGPDHFAILDDRFYRAYGTFEQPNPYAGYLGLTASLAVGVIGVGMGDRLPWLWRTRGDHSSPALRGRWSGPLLAYFGVAAVVLAAALGMSWSRGAWVGFAAAMLAMAIALPRRAVWGVAAVVVLVAALAALHATGLLPTAITARLTGFAEYVRFQDVRGAAINDANYSVIERFAHWQAALAMFRDNLWLGVGFGAYEPAYPGYALINWPYALGHAHNYYLTIAAETGILGLAAYLGLWSIVAWRTWRASRRTRGLARGAAIGLLGAWTHLGVHSLLDNLFVNNVHLQVGVMLGILAYLLREADRGSYGVD
jgi:O-antigen ligase